MTIEQNSYEQTDKMIMDKLEKLDEMKPLVIYHGNCADGFSAAWCFWQNGNLMGNNVYDFHAGVYSDPPPDCTDRVVYLVDFSYKRSVVKEICKTAKEVILIDHHKTAIDDLGVLLDEGEEDFQENFKWYVDIERSGAILAWDFLHNTQFEAQLTIKPSDASYVQPPLLLNHIQDRDLWKFKLAGTREISADVFSWEYTFENWDRLMKANQAELLQMTAAGAAIERKHHKDIAELVKVCERTLDIGGYLVPVASLPYTLTSDAGHLMAKNYLGGGVFAACYWDTPTHRIFSLRSTENGMDVSEIAKHYGGGGHKNAAGFRVPRDHELARS